MQGQELRYICGGCFICLYDFDIFFIVHLLGQKKLQRSHSGPQVVQYLLCCKKLMFGGSSD